MSCWTNPSVYQAGTDDIDNDRRNKIIDEQIEKEKRESMKVFKILLLGIFFVRLVKVLCTFENVGQKIHGDQNSQKTY